MRDGKEKSPPQRRELVPPATIDQLEIGPGCLEVGPDT